MFTKHRKVFVKTMSYIHISIYVCMSLSLCEKKYKIDPRNSYFDFICLGDSSNSVMFCSHSYSQPSSLMQLPTKSSSIHSIDI